MTAKKSGSGGGSKKTEDSERMWLKAEHAANGFKKLIRSMKMNTEQKITLEDGINNLANEVESIMDRIDMASKVADQKRLLAAYKKFLEDNIEVVNQRLRKKD